MVYLIQYYHHKKGKQAKTLIREMRRKNKFLVQKSNSGYPKILERLWLEISFQNPIYDNQNHDDGHCSCKCTPIIKEVRSSHSKRKPEPDKEGY